MNYGQQELPADGLAGHDVAPPMTNDEESRTALDNLAAGIGTDTHFPCWPAHQPEHAALTGPG